METIVEFNYSSFDSAVDLRGKESDFAPGSRNLIPFGTRQYRPFRGLDLLAGAGARRLFPIKDTWGGLDDYGGNPGAGSLFSTLADALVFVGNGQVQIEGAAVPGAIATANPKILLKWNGSYTDPRSGPFILGLSPPTAPLVGILDVAPSGGVPVTAGTYTFKGARLRATTGGKSRASATSQVVSLTGKAAFYVVPLAAEGQNVHPIFVTSAGLGGVGLHYRMARANPYTGAEYTEDDVQRTIATLAATNGSPVITSSASDFSAQDAGKRFSPVSAGFTVPAATTVLSVDSPMQITLSNPVTVSSGANPRSAELISYVGGIDRGVCLNWSESDLSGEAAETSWLYDYPPEASSHAFQLENRIVVATYADSSSGDLTSAQNPGTALLFSLSNQLESFDVRYPMYLPEGVVDIIGRGLDSYRFIGTRNGIYAVQYLSSEIPATLSVILPNEGIKNGNNWCLAKRGMYVFCADGKLVRIGEGGAFEEVFAEPIRRHIRNWTQDDSVVSYDPRASGVVLSNGVESFYYDEMNDRWSVSLVLNETDAAGLSAPQVISGLGTRGKMILCLEDAANNRYAYTFDEGSGSYVAGVSPYIKRSFGEKNHAMVSVQRIAAQAVSDRTDKTMYLGIHSNLRKTHLMDIATTNGSPNAVSPDAEFNDEYLGQFILIKGAGAGGKWLLARIRQIINPATIALGTLTENLSDSAPLNASANVSAGYALIATRFFPVKPNIKGTIQIESPEIHIPACHALAASIVIETVGIDAQPLQCVLFGDASGEQWTLPGGVWGEEV